MRSHTWLRVGSRCVPSRRFQALSDSEVDSDVITHRQKYVATQNNDRPFCCSSNLKLLFYPLTDYSELIWSCVIVRSNRGRVVNQGETQVRKPSSDYPQFTTATVKWLYRKLTSPSIKIEYSLRPASNFHWTLVQLYNVQWQIKHILFWLCHLKKKNFFTKNCHNLTWFMQRWVTATHYETCNCCKQNNSFFLPP